MGQAKMKTDQWTNVGGLTALGIAQSLRDTYYDLIDRTPAVEWGDLQPSDRNRWGLAVEVLIGMYESQEGAVSARELTRGFVDTVFGQTAFENLPALLQLVWEAVLRRGVNLIQAGQPMDGEHIPLRERKQEYQEAVEYDWGEWVQNECRKRGLTRV